VNKTERFRSVCSSYPLAFCQLVLKGRVYGTWRFSLTAPRGNLKRWTDWCFRPSFLTRSGAMSVDLTALHSNCVRLFAVFSETPRVTRDDRDRHRRLNILVHQYKSTRHQFLSARVMCRRFPERLIGLRQEKGLRDIRGRMISPQCCPIR